MKERLAEWLLGHSKAAYIGHQIVRLLAMLDLPQHRVSRLTERESRLTERDVSEFTWQEFKRGSWLGFWWGALAGTFWGAVATWGGIVLVRWVTS